MNDKWQRIKYMPGTGIGENGARVTGCKAHIELSRRAAEEGAVLLKNEENVLPFQSGQKIAVFGKAATDYVKGGGGSGDVSTAYVRSIVDGLELKAAEGKVELVNTKEAEAKIELLKADETAGSIEICSEASALTDTALIVIGRYSEEGCDRTGEPYDGDFYLSHEESELVAEVCDRFSKVVVVLNTGGIIETRWIKERPAIKACLLAGQGGMEGGLAVADILCGDVNPSGHLADTYAESFEAYPAAEHFHDSDDYVEYTEGIWVGYRYFETEPDAASKVVYPFGYGLSYTTFDITNVSAELPPENHVANNPITLRCTLTNTGEVAGREVVQVYAEPPEGKLAKSRLSLIGFHKTRLLGPGESERIEIEVKPYVMASYDESSSCYVLEKGEYRFHIGANVRDTKEVTQLLASDGKAMKSLTLDQDIILEQLSSKCAPRKERVAQDDLAKVPFDGQAPLEETWVQTGSLWSKPEDPQLIDVYEGRLTLDEFMSHLTDEMKIHLLGGQPNRGPCNTMGIGNIPRFGIPSAMTADGPAGLRFLESTGVKTTAFPVASLLAQTWDEELLHEIGRCAAEELHENGIAIWLAPAINIHRNPLCGRNFEYFSEDPLVAGKLAASLIRGVESMGVAATVKHLACNNKETNRRESDSRVSERALREIYLKAFEICVKEADPWVVMTSYNLINGVRASENEELLEGILRGEWDYDGLVITDWYTHGEQFREINAGNDVKMACGTPDFTLDALRDGRLDREAMDRSARRVLELLLKLK